MSRLGVKCNCKDEISSPIATYTEHDAALCSELRRIAEAISAPGKGLLASDESPGSLQKRFDELGVENSETTRRDYREMLFSADKTRLSRYISGAILHHETVYQRTSGGVEMVDFLRQRGVVAGVKVDRGLVRLFGTDNEDTAQGLDDLQERCAQYKRDGCHFAKWRCTFSIGPTTPSPLATLANANVLARYASICQSARMVPIVEPEILNAGEHGINKSLQVHQEVYSALFRALHEHRVYLEGMILKPAMVLSGMKSTKNCTPQIVAEYTLTAMQRTVPVAVPAILFLSGGQSDQDSVSNLNAINSFDGRKPWTTSFCYGRALQNAAMNAWKGDPANVSKAQAVFLERARLCSEASMGQSELDDADKCTKTVNKDQ